MIFIRKFCTVYVLIFASIAFAQTPSPAIEEEPVEITHGLDVSLVMDFAFERQGIQIGDRSLLAIDFIQDRRELIVRSLKPVGSTSITIRDVFGNIKKRYVATVISDNNSKIIKELREFLGDVEGLIITKKGDKVVVEGKLVVPNDIGKIAVVLDNYPSVIRLIELAPQSQLVIAKKMQEEIQNSGMKNVTVRILNGMFWLEGIVASEDQKLLAKIIAEAYIPDRIDSLAVQTKSVGPVRGRGIIQNLVTISKKAEPEPLPKQIKVISQFVELAKDYSRIFGFKWNPGLTAGGGSIQIGKTTDGDVTTASQGTLSAVINNLFPKLAAAKSAGHARLIQSAMVLTKNNTPASVSKGITTRGVLGTGEFQQADSANTEFSLNVTPKILEEENIEMKLVLKAETQTGSTPREVNNSIDTTVVVKSKESAVLGGIAINETSTDFDKDPPDGVDSFAEGGGTALFSFLRSKSFVKNKSQYVVFVTPEIVESASAGTEEIKTKFKRRR